MSGNNVLKITEKDIIEANQLSLSCPICASAVEKNAPVAALSPVICSKCETLYHKTCWEQNDGKCATLGCEHTVCHPIGPELEPGLTIKYADIPKHPPSRPSPNGRSERLKAQEKRRQESGEGKAPWRELFSRILRALGWR